MSLRACMLRAGVVSLLLLYLSNEVEAGPEKRGFPAGVREVTFESSGDGTSQPALFWAPENAKDPVPLLVGLHTWSGDYRQGGSEVVYAEWCKGENWAFIHPNFRGPNRTEDAMGSDLAVADIASAVLWAQSEASIDPMRIYAVGVSGGGHAALLVSARLPEIWAGVSAWCGISDIARWHEETSAADRDKYAKDIEMALGGIPSPGTPEEKSAWQRSPLAWLKNATSIPLDIHHGIDDGRKGSVPFSHSLRAWNEIVPEGERFPANLIEQFYQTQAIPDPLAAFAAQGSFLLYGDRVPLFRRAFSNTRVTVFQGGHEIVHNVALNWLAAQKKGQPAVWDPDPVRDLGSSDSDSRSGL